MIVLVLVGLVLLLSEEVKESFRSSARVYFRDPYFGSRRSVLSVGAASRGTKRVGYRSGRPSLLGYYCYNELRTRETMDGHGRSAGIRGDSRNANFGQYSDTIRVRNGYKMGLKSL